ncbi:MAG: hypothetical protein ACR2L3_05700 [Actinomycetota bacterium]
MTYKTAWRMFNEIRSLLVQRYIRLVSLTCSDRGADERPMRLRAAGLVGLVGLVVLLSLTACSEPSGTEPSPPSGTETSTGDPTPTETPTQTPTQTPTADPKPVGAPVVENGRCSDEIVEYMGNESTSTVFKSGFGLPVLLDGLDVGCTAIARKPSFAGFFDTFAFVRREPNIDDLLSKRIVALGYTRDSLAPGVFINAAGEPEGFIRILGEGREPKETKFAEDMQWVVIQFFLPG